MLFFQDEQAPWTELGQGLRRKVVGHTPQLMTVLMEFDEGAVGMTHTHAVHDQIAYVLAGAFEATLDGATRVLRVGDAFIAAHGVAHGVRALEPASRLLDQFSPRRDDYLAD